MGRMTATTVYLDETQRKGLYRLAKARGSHFSKEVRTAIQHHLALQDDDTRIVPQEVERLAREAGRSLDRMIKRLDETNRRLDTVIRTVGRSNRQPRRGRQ